jgi:diguanylate cyclase (GGDEF)-like protein
VVEHVLVQLLDVTARREAAARLEKAALTDSLTGLANRAVLEDRLTRALATARLTQARVGVLFIDLDHFKDINDTYGHDVGDVLLRQVGMRLAGTVRHSDTVVRLGGDEFVVFREDFVDVDELNDFADRVREAFVTPFIVEGCDVIVAASVGATFGNGDTARQLLSRADDAMYRIKRSRRGETVDLDY